MKFSVIIPTCDRPEPLRECLRRVLRQEVDNYEVIVTDDSLMEPPYHPPPGVRWVRGPRRGPAANRNAGARQATGEWLVFLDDDCIPADQWLAAYEAAATPELDVLEGRTECPAADAFAFDDIVENLTGGAYWSCNLAVRREVFEEMRGFDEDFLRPCAEDMEFAWRMRRRGLKSRFVKEATVTHPARRLDLRGLITRTASHRWVILYRLKTGHAPACSAIGAVVDLLAREYLDTLRMAWHLRRPDERRRIKGRTLAVLWRWGTLGIFLPWYIYWDLRFRRMLAKR